MEIYRKEINIMENIKNMLNELRPEFNFDESDNFIEDGYLDSFDVVSLIAMIEEKFNVTIDGMDIVPENFISYEAISCLIKKSGE
ncbi:MAG: acyl carrier protein [Anaerovoracaceae bacterium]